MKPFLGVNLTTDKKNAQINGREFLIQTPSVVLSSFFETSADEAKETVENAKIPLLLRVIKTLCGFSALIIFAGILKADVTFIEGYQNAPRLYWATGICAVVWLVLWLYAKHKARSVMGTDESAQIFSHLDSASESIYKDLGVPDDAKEVDLLMFFYKERNGDIKVCEKFMQMSQYFNPVFKVFTDKEYLYFANLDGKYAFPLSSVTKIHTVKKHIRIAGWNKEEAYNEGIYKQYKLATDNYNCVHCKTYHILEIEHNGAEWGIFIPCYELLVFEEIYEMAKAKTSLKGEDK